MRFFSTLHTMPPILPRVARRRQSLRTVSSRPGWTFLALFSAPLIACSGAAPEAPGGAETWPSTAHPIIVLDLDTVRADHLGCYGYGRDTTPRIDAFAAEAVRFEWAFSQAPNTQPSQASILTSLYPSSHGSQGDAAGLPEAAVTLPEVLGAAGYTTAAFVDGGYVSASFGLDQGFDLFDNQRGGGLAQIAPRVADWLTQQPAEPFFLFVHTYDAHTPYAPEEPYRSMFTDGLAPATPGFEPNAETLEAARRAAWSADGTGARLPEEDLAYAKARYDGGLRHLDAWVGALLDRFAESGLLERATIVVLSDHGEEFGEHGSVLHEKLYAPVTRVPLIVRPPGGLAGGRVVHEVVQTLDVMPTLLALAGVSGPTTMQGRDLGLLLAGGREGPGFAVGESPYFGERRFVARGTRRLLRTERDGRVEVYAYREDRAELVDLAPQEPDIARTLGTTLDGWTALVERHRLPTDGEGPGETPIDPETLEQLRALGYIQ